MQWISSLKCVRTWHHARCPTRNLTSDAIGRLMRSGMLRLRFTPPIVLSHNQAGFFALMPMLFSKRGTQATFALKPPPTRPKVPRLEPPFKPPLRPAFKTTTTDHGGRGRRRQGSHGGGWSHRAELTAWADPADPNPQPLQHDSRGRRRARRRRRRAPPGPGAVRSWAGQHI